MTKKPENQETERPRRWNIVSGRSKGVRGADEAEIRNGAGWRRIGIAEALSEPRSSVMRCLGCGGRVKAHREGTTAQRAHFEHYQKHAGCRLKPSTFDGTATRHPHALD